MEKKLTDLIPCKKYTTTEISKEIDYAITDGPDQYYKVSDIEDLLTKLSRPENISKVTKALMFGQKIEITELLK